MAVILRVAAVARPRFDVRVGRLARRTVTGPWPFVVVAASVCAWAFDRVVVRGASMAPTFLPGDRLLLVRRLRPLRRGDLVALDDPWGSGRRLVKRVVAIRDEEVDVAGDNSVSSTDSRSFGPVHPSSIRHLVVRRYARGDAP